MDDLKSEDKGTNYANDEKIRKNKTWSLLFTDFFKVISKQNLSTTAQCIACNENGNMKLIKGMNSSNFLKHLKTIHEHHYDRFMVAKEGIKRPRCFMAPLTNTSTYFGDDSDNSDDEKQNEAQATIFQAGYFDIIDRTGGGNVKANCMVCHQLGRSHFIHGKVSDPTNFLLHLQRMHDKQYKEYTKLEQTNDAQSPNADGCDESSSKSTVPTIKSEYVEFVDVNEEFDNYESNTMGSFDSFTNDDFLEGEDGRRKRSTRKASVAQEESYDSADNDDSNDPSYMPAMSASSNHNKVANEDITGRKLPLVFRAGFFKFIKKEFATMIGECVLCGPGSVYRGTEKSTSNFLSHLKRRHPDGYNKFLRMREEELNKRNSYRSEARKREESAENFTQSDFDRIVVNFMTNGLHPISLLEDESFATLLNDIATHKTKSKASEMKYKIISPTDLNSSIDKRIAKHKADVQSLLEKAFYISTTVDAYQFNSKIFLAIAAHWIDVRTFRKMSAIITCDKLNAFLRHVNEAILERILSVYSEHEIEKKVVANVTNNDSDVKCLFSKVGLHGLDETDSSGIDSNFTYLDIEGVENEIKCPTYMFELICAEDAAKALEDSQYASCYKRVFDKLNDLWTQSRKSTFSQQIEDILGTNFPQPNHSAFTSFYDSICSLLKFNVVRLNEVLNLLQIDAITNEDSEFLKEYVKIMEPIYTALDYLQKNDCYYATFLPMVHSTKDNLLDIKANEISHCLPLLNAILNGIEERFGHLFEFTNEKCIWPLVSTCSHPYFKMRWLKGDLKTPSNTNLILDILVKAAKSCKINLKEKRSNATLNQTSEKEPSTKKFKFSFDTTSKEEPDDETTIQMDIMAFLKKPCHDDDDNLLELQQHPCVQKLFIKYNSIVPSSAYVQRLCPLSDTLKNSEHEKLNDEIYTKLLVLRAKSMIAAKGVK